MSHFVNIPCIFVISRYRGTIAMTGCAAYRDMHTEGVQQSCDVKMDMQKCEAYRELIVNDGKGTYKVVGPSNHI